MTAIAPYISDTSHNVTDSTMNFIYREIALRSLHGEEQCNIDESDLELHHIIPKGFLISEFMLNGLMRILQEEGFTVTMLRKWTQPCPSNWSLNIGWPKGCLKQAS